MTDEDLIGYLIGSLDPEDQTSIEAHLRASSDDIARLERLRIVYAPLEADREPGLPPPGLAIRTIARLAAHLAELEPQNARPSEAATLSAVLDAVLEQPLESSTPAAREEERPPVFPAPARSLPRAPREEPEIRTVGGRFRLDLIIACGIAFFACGLLFSAIGKVRARNQLLACQANLQTLHVGLVGYADTHNGHYPQIAPDATADSFATALVDAGQVPVGFRPGCPATAASETTPVRYTYSLGFQTPTGVLVGLHRPDSAADEHDLLPISADYPTASATPFDGPLCDHPPQMNVLLLGGQVRVTTSPLIGPNGDDIYRNVYGHVAAGIDRTDVVLGRPGDRP
jgi:hypothetical protein